MADEYSEQVLGEEPSLMDDKFHHHQAEEDAKADDSSSDSEREKPAPDPAPMQSAPPIRASSSSSTSSSAKDRVNRFFGREKPVHQVLGGGKPADVLLWRNKKASAGVLGIATAIWVIFELLEYHLLTLICHILILSLAILFLWANASTFVNKSLPCIPEVRLPQEQIIQFSSSVRIQLNRGLYLLREIALGREWKKFLVVIAVLWLISVLGSYCNFLTFLYIIFVVLHTMPLLYEKHEHKIDSFANRAAVEVKNKCSLVNDKYLSKIPKLPKNKKAA